MCFGDPKNRNIGSSVERLRVFGRGAHQTTGHRLVKSVGLGSPKRIFGRVRIKVLTGFSAVYSLEYGYYVGHQYKLVKHVLMLVVYIRVDVKEK